MELEEKALQARDRLAEAVAYEHSLTLRLEDLVHALPKLKREQHMGYVHVEECKRDLQDVRRRSSLAGVVCSGVP